MWFSLFGFVLILCVAFFQALQGAFSAVIMCVLTILSATLAFGLYEDLYAGALTGPLPDQGEAVALVGIFLLTLLILRVLADNMIKGNMQFPVWVDRIVGGAFGIVSALIMVGMLQLGFQLLPFSDTFLGFNRFPTLTADGRKEIDEEKLKDYAPDQVTWPTLAGARSPWLSADDFTVGIVSMLSDGVLSGQTRFRDVHPNFTAEIQNSRCGVQRESRRVLPSTAAVTLASGPYSVLPVGRMYRPTKEEKPVPTPRPKEGWEWRIYRVTLGADAKDSDNRFFRFRAPQVRIVGRDRKGGPTTEYILKGVSREAKTTKLPEYLELFRAPVAGKEDWCDVVRSDPAFSFVFEVPTTFEAWFIEFKRTGRVDVSNVKPSGVKMSSVAPKGSKGGETAPEAETVFRPEQHGRVSGVQLAGIPEFRAGNPFPLKQTEYSLANGEVRGNKLIDGHIKATVKEGGGGDSNKRIDAFDVPAELRLVYVPVDEQDPESVPGQALNYTARSLPSVRLKTGDGQERRPAGKYAFANVGGGRAFECFYFSSEEARAADQPMPIFDTIPHNVRTQRGTEYIYLFLVPPRVRLDALLAGKQSDDLTRYNLQAPP